MPPVATIQLPGMPHHPSAVPTRPFLALYVAWHPNFKAGAEISLALFQHYRRDLYRNVAGGSGLPVIYRSQPPEGGAVPIDIDLEGAEATAVVLLVDENWSRNSAWVAWARRISDEADRTGLRALVFPVAIDGSGIAMGVLPEQAVRWDRSGPQAGSSEAPSAIHLTFLPILQDAQALSRTHEAAGGVQ